MDVRKMGKEEGVNHEKVAAVDVQKQVPPDPNSTPDSSTKLSLELPTLKPLDAPTPKSIEQLSTKNKPHKKVRKGPTAKITTKTVEIKFAYPTIPEHRVVTAAKKKVARKVATIPRKKLVTGGVLFAVALIAFSGYFLATNRNANVAADKQVTKSPHELLRGTPDYPTLLPDSKTIEDLGGWTLVSPPDRNAVYAYVDKIGEVQINVSQQPLPEEFISDPDEQIELLARGYKASEKVTVGETVVHIGTSALGPQSVIFYKDNLLILIKSTVPVSSDEWAKYVSSLH